VSLNCLLMSCLHFVCIAYSVIMVDCANTESSHSLLTVFPVDTYVVMYFYDIVLFELC